MSDCNTRLAQGGIAAAIGLGDSPEKHFRDTIKAGAGLCDEVAARIMVEEAPARIADLVSLGVEFDTVDGQVALALEAAHSMPRILHAGGDATGARIEEALSRMVLESSIEIEEESLATEVVVDNGTAVGLKVLNSGPNTNKEIAARYIILATGGAGRLYRLTTNPEVATGDGVALAFNAGARITDVEFFQFHPTALCYKDEPPFLISEAVRGEGAILLNSHKERFMPKYAHEAELAPRDIVARAIVSEMVKTGRGEVYLDMRHMAPQRTTSRFPQISRFCLQKGLDITRELIPVAPAAHYMVGGVMTSYRGETDIKNLFAAGEVACTGVHGANRLASNSLMEVLVFSRRIIEHTLGNKNRQDPQMSRKLHPYSLRELPCGKKDIIEPDISQLQNLMWNKAGIIRSRKGLIEARKVLAGWQGAVKRPQSRKEHEKRNLLTVARLLVEAAFIRQESRGAHFCLDYPEAREEWRKHIVLSKE